MFEKILESPLIELVKSGEMEAFPGQSVGDALDGHDEFDNKKWDVVGGDVVFVADVPVHPGSMLGRKQFSFQYKAVFGVSGTSFRLISSNFLVHAPKLKEPIKTEDSNFEALKLIYQRFSLEKSLVQAAMSAGIVAMIGGAKTQKVETKADLKTVVPITADFTKGSAGTILTLKTSELQAIRVAYVPGGDFIIGSTADDPADPSKSPQQAQVHLSSHFWMAVTEITQSQWQQFMETNPSSNQSYRVSDGKKDTSKHPVENLTHAEAQLFVNYLQRLRPLPAGWEWALPTEAQWEHACREGLSGREWRSITGEQAWLKTNSGGDDNASTQPVASKKPNALGIYDLMGNVMEFTRNVVPREENDAERGYVDELLGGTDPVGFAPAADLSLHEDPYSKTLRKRLDDLKAKQITHSNELPIYLYPEHDMLRQRFGKHIYKYIGNWQQHVLRGGSYASSTEELHPARRWKIDNSVKGGDAGFRIVIVKTALNFEPPTVGKGDAGELDSGNAGTGIEYKLDGDSPPFVLRCVPAGEHPLGTYVAHLDQFKGHPKRIVRLAHPFWVAEAEMTESQLQALFPNDEGGHSSIMPARNINAELAASIVAKLNTKKLLPAGWIWSLPTTEQWEIACRGGVADEFAGNLNEMAWYLGNDTQPVKTAHPNALGIYDMHGNVAEWCLPLPEDFDYLIKPVGFVVKPVGRLKGGAVDSDGSHLTNICSYNSVKVGSHENPRNVGLRLFIIPEEKAKAAIQLVSLDSLNHPESIQKFQALMSRAAQLGMIFTSTLGAQPISDTSTCVSPSTALTAPASDIPSSTAMAAITLGGEDGVRLKIAELEGHLVAVNMRIEAERKRWQDANSAINALTNNGTMPVRRNSPEHVKMYENQVVMKQVEGGAGSLKEEKARIEAMLKSLKTK